MRLCFYAALTCTAVFCFWGSARAELVSSATIDQVLADADRLDLAAERGWSTLLFMRERVFGPPSSMVATSLFYFADKADWTPKAELQATITALLTGKDERTETQAANDRDYSPADFSPTCRFPARTAWLKEHLPSFKNLMRPTACPALTEWLTPLRTMQVSLVFSSYFSGNPSSMFGHSFLRLHKRPLPNQVASDMLDETLNFMAYPTTENPLLYAAAGLMGQFPGRFSILPFYYKIQEYNNAESRDLWEYELNLTPAEIERLQLVLWEMGPHTINYYYFDENCSLIILAVLEATKPTLHLAPLHPWVIPSDTVRVLNRSPGLVSAIHYRPSALSRFLASYRGLSGSGKKLVEQILVANDAKQAAEELSFAGRSDTAEVIDATIEYIDYAEKLAGTKAATIYGELRGSLLLRRAASASSITVPKPPTPLGETPHLGGGTTRMGGGIGYSPRYGLLSEADWRPALHDVADPDLGYSEGLAITFFDMVLRYLPKNLAATTPTPTAQVFLQRFSVLTITSTPSLEPVVRPIAWELGLGAENRGACTQISVGCYVNSFSGGRGVVATAWGVTSYATAHAVAGFSGENALRAFAGPGVRAGAVLPFTPLAKLSAEGSIVKKFGPDGFSFVDRRGYIEYAALLREHTELRCRFERRPDASEILVNGEYFF